MTRRPLLAAALLAALAMSSLTALAPASADTDLRTVAGTVSGPSGDPVGDITVEISPTAGGEVHSATTDADGHYTVSDVEPGPSVVEARDASNGRDWRPAYWDGTGTTTSYPSPAPEIPAGPGTTTIDFSLQVASGILGKAVDESGAPLQNIEWNVETYDPATGTWEGVQAGPLLTDADGTFWFPTKPDGRYKVCLHDTYYDDSEVAWRPEYRYTAACYGAATDTDATVITPDPAQPRTEVTVPLSVAGRSLATTEPIVTGTRAVGQPLTIDPGVWEPGDTALSYQWQRYTDDTGWVDIAGATTTTYTPTADDAGKDLYVVVTGDRAGYVSATRQGYAGTVGDPTPTFDSPPALTGTPAVGETLTLSVGATDPADAQVEYQWFADSRRLNISYDNWTSLTLTPAMAGTTITVRVRADDYSTRSNSAWATTSVGPVS